MRLVAVVSLVPFVSFVILFVVRAVLVTTAVFTTWLVRSVRFSSWLRPSSALVFHVAVFGSTVLGPGIVLRTPATVFRTLYPVLRTRRGMIAAISIRARHFSIHATVLVATIF